MKSPQIRGPRSRAGFKDAISIGANKPTRAATTKPMAIVARVAAARTRPDEGRADVPRYLRPWETTAPGQRQRDGRVQVRAGHGAGRVDGEHNREAPEESCAQQAGLEAVPTGARLRIGDKAVAQEN